MTRTHQITLGGQTYPLRFSLRAFRYLRDTYGHKQADYDALADDLVLLGDWLHAGLIGGLHKLSGPDAVPSREDLDELVDMENLRTVFEALNTALTWGLATDAEGNGTNADPPTVATVDAGSLTGATSSA